MPPRPPRSIPHLLKVAQYWHQHQNIETLLPRWRGLYTGLGEPFCGACGWLAPVMPLDLATPEEGGLDFPEIWRRAARWLDRAHIITRATGKSGSGLDTPANLIQLCQLCHKQMPLFDGGEEAIAMEWLRAMPRADWRWQRFTDSYPWPDCRWSMSTAFLIHERLLRAAASRAEVA